MAIRRGMSSDGTIPAWAGEPVNIAGANPGVRDHPRVGGGTAQVTLKPWLIYGPSPRGRGNRALTPALQAASGTIPAWAGEPPSPEAVIWNGWDHPRVGGGTP